MKASELRIGNLVLCEGEVATVQIIHGRLNIVVVNTGERDWCNNPDKLQPIPLTPEILDACGFEKREGCFHLVISDKYDDIYLVWRKDKEFGIGEYNQDRDRLEILSYTIPCAALHQLQNLYFALTGEELEIDEEKLKQATI